LLASQFLLGRVYKNAQAFKSSMNDILKQNNGASSNVPVLLFNQTRSVWTGRNETSGADIYRNITVSTSD
jgi:hypothetical protein